MLKIIKKFNEFDVNNIIPIICEFGIEIILPKTKSDRNKFDYCFKVDQLINMGYAERI